MAGPTLAFSDRLGQFASVGRFTPEPAKTRSDHARAIRRRLVCILIAAIFLQRFALHPGGPGISLHLSATLLALGALFLRRHISFGSVRAALVFLSAACAMISIIVPADVVASRASAGLAIFNDVPFACLLLEWDALFTDRLHAFRLKVVICAFCRIEQLFLPAVISLPYHGCARQSASTQYRDHRPGFFFQRLDRPVAPILARA